MSIVFRYTGEGFVPGRIDPEPLEDVAAITFLGQKVVEKYPVLKDWMVGSPADVKLEEKAVETGPYRGFRSIGIESVYPIVEGYLDDATVGFRLNLSDPMLLNRIHLSASYTPNSSLPADERLHLELGLERYD